MLHALAGLVTGTTTTTASGGAAGAILIFYVVFYLVFCLPLMGIFRKAQQPGWAAFVPIYNIYVMLKLVGRPGWWLIFFFIPLVNIVIGIVVYYDLSRSFGHGGGFTVGLVLLNWIFLMILWLGQSTYRGPAAAGGATGYPPPQAGGWPQQPGAYPQQPGAWPQQPGAYPQQPGAYPQQPPQPQGPPPGPQGQPGTGAPEGGGAAPPFFPPPATPPATPPAGA